MPGRDHAGIGVGGLSGGFPATVNDDDLGVLSATFNRMQAGLAERPRLHSAFGTYVDPALTSQLLEQGDDVFTGEHRDVTALFIDVRDFTAYADTHTADESVARLNELFAIVVPIITSIVREVFQTVPINEKNGALALGAKIGRAHV